MTHALVDLPSLDSVALVCLVLDPAGRVTWGNAAGESVGWSPREEYRRFTDVVHPGDRTEVEGMLDEAAECGQAERTIRARRSDAGELSYLHCTVSRTRRDDRPADAGYDHVRCGDMVVQGWDVTKSVIRERALELYAYRDPLTGVANRLAFMDRLDRELALPAQLCGRVAVLFADVDDFKKVNDTHGHETGDRVLIGLAGRLSAVLRRVDLLGRIGGDEFAVICPDLLGWPAAVALIERLRSVAAVPIGTPDGEIAVSLSVGAAFVDHVDPHPDQALDLLARADAQMFRMKSSVGEEIDGPGSRA